MFAFALAVGFSDDVPSAARAAQIASAFPFTPTDGIASAQRGHAAAAILRWSVVASDRHVAPIWDAERKLFFVGDVRLYNRPELVRSLGLSSESSEVSDARLAWLAYLRWKADAPRHLVGDFAFVVWDESERMLFAARDHTGVRPLYYRAVKDGWVVASDVRQILAATGRPNDEEVNPHRILTYLMPPIHQPGATFFRNVSLLRPGHFFTATERGGKEQRYWTPPTPPIRPRSYAENCEELLRIFRRAVRERLRSDHPIVAHSSGGFDSSTILMVADEVYRAEPHRPKLIMASATAAGFPCDDSRYMDAVAERVQFEGVRWKAARDGLTQSLEVSIVRPRFRSGPAGGPRTDLALARDRGARILLSGQGGDEVLYAGGVFSDLFSRGRWGQLLRETLLWQRPVSRGGRMLIKSFLGVFPPVTAFNLCAQIFGRPGPPPPWLGPRLLEVYPPAPDFVDSVNAPFESHVATSLWIRIQEAQVTNAISNAVLYGAEEGIETRLPFSDVRLVEQMLTIPWDQRVPQGHLRRTGRDALGAVLPPEFSHRAGQVSWAPVWNHNARSARGLVVDTLSRGDWLSESFVSRASVQSILGEIDEVGDDPRWTFLLRVAGLESWLRQLFCYSPAREVTDG